MPKNYDKVPAIISSKDLDYLADIFNWNFVASKKTLSYNNLVQDPKIKKLMSKVHKTHTDHAKKILQILQIGGQ